MSELSPERIKRLADEAPKVRLALSLHSATLPLRQQLIPSATSMPELCSQAGRASARREMATPHGSEFPPSREKVKSMARRWGSTPMGV